MYTYARIENGVVMELFDTELDIYEIFSTTLTWVNVTGHDPAIGQMDGAALIDGAWVFTPYSTPAPTPEQVLASQSYKLQQATQLAAAQKTALSNRISTLNDGIELEEATPAEVAELPVRQAQLIEWKRYALYLGRVTTQAGWPPDVVWPVQPAAGMDLTVSAVSPGDQFS